MTAPPEPTREVHCADALEWLRARGPIAGAALITSLPDVSELGGMDLATWRAWFIAAAEAVLSAMSPDGLAIFYQTDVKVAGVWIDKAYLVQRAAEAQGAALLWHKIVCRKPAGAVTFGRPAYAHLLAFGRDLRDDPGRSTADVLPGGGWMSWARAIGADAALFACRAAQRSGARVIVDPFCGKGTILAAAGRLGLPSIGVDRSPKRCREAERLTLPDSAAGSPAADP